MVVNQFDCSRLEQRYVNKYLESEKSKLYEIYRTESNVNGNEWAKHRFASTNICRKKSPMSKNTLTLW